MKTEIIEVDKINSTNEFCKKLNLEDVIVVAGIQTDGRGTKGRKFVSDEGGLYLSVAKKYADFDFANTFTIMINACVAVCKTLELFNLKPQIKWANDVLVNGKKICGTLIENRLGADGACHSIVGIGLNVNNLLPDDLKDTATTMKSERGKQLPLKKVRDALIKNLEKEYSVDEYKAYIDWFGREITLDCNGNIFTAVARDIGADGALICDVNGKTKKISSAEISLRL